MIRIEPLWADWEDILRIAVFVVPVLVYVFNQLFGGQAKPQPGRPLNPGPRPNVDPMAPRPPQPDRPAVDQELEEFLRRAAQARGNRPPREVEVVVREAPKPPAPPRRDQRPPRPPQQAPLVVEVAPVPVQAVGPSRIDDMVRQDLSKSLAVRRAKESEVEQADEEMSAHLHQTFDHRLGQLAGETKSTTADATPAATPVAPARLSPAAEMAVLLRDPRTLRQMIVLQEVLRRPEDRW